MEVEGTRNEEQYDYHTGAVTGTQYQSAIRPRRGTGRGRLRGIR
ncbi:hypothetical protein FTUN_8165 [Frigoriglobus tundricola]|uniref:Uncharacterized protein n=1 Tax=Frigoriglobus tundricola TaxID=2774151 RepID=A0A6M5Z489_9BACT|nr:hypothetical protein FTUN_8165 [Frigoriglobus tundricola]